MTSPALARVGDTVGRTAWSLGGGHARNHGPHHPACAVLVLTKSPAPQCGVRRQYRRGNARPYQPAARPIARATGHGETRRPPRRADPRQTRHQDTFCRCRGQRMVAQTVAAHGRTMSTKKSPAGTTSTNLGVSVTGIVTWAAVIGGETGIGIVIWTGFRALARPNRAARLVAGPRTDREGRPRLPVKPLPREGARPARVAMRS